MTDHCHFLDFYIYELCSLIVYKCGLGGFGVIFKGLLCFFEVFGLILVFWGRNLSSGGLFLAECRIISFFSVFEEKKLYMNYVAKDYFSDFFALFSPQFVILSLIFYQI
jgi:hypothetical protein